jgi:hypothetical protein
MPTTLQVNVIIGLGWTLAIVAFAAFGWLGAAGAMIAAVLHNLSTLLVLGNAGRLLRFQEPLLKLKDTGRFRVLKFHGLYSGLLARLKRYLGY